MADRKTLTLKANSGQDECNYGTERFTVDPRTHEVEVPEEAAAPLIAVGGFALVSVPVPVPEGMVRLQHAEGIGCSWGGKSYDPESDGSVVVPMVAGGDLRAHGFFPVEAPVSATADDTAEPTVEAPQA